MSQPRLRQRAISWTPRALVVISCALALLAVQPASAAPAARNRPMVSKEAPAAPSATSWEITRRTSTIATHPVARTSRNETLFAGSQRLHILATVEILQRLLVTELQPVQQHFLAGMWLLTECPAVVTLQLAFAAPSHRRFSLTGPQPDAEKAFAMAHCQLAPPPSSLIA